MICLSLRSSAEVIVPAVQYLTEILRGAAAEKEIRWIQLGLQEALGNAFEHGNLGIGAEAKRRLNKNEGAIERKALRRKSAAKKGGKLVDINAAFADGVFFCSIEDSGPGFDWRTALEIAKEPPPATATEGRGLFLLKKIFDQVKYNRSGNKITLLKKISAKNITAKKLSGNKIKSLRRR